MKGGEHDKPEVGKAIASREVVVKEYVEAKRANNKRERKKEGLKSTTNRGKIMD